ncbi:MAG: hypothetical protein J6D47_05975 [Peptostreptococcaceae bacterium]|nr:hypothetical protein [Peptostreptococcaceae bacterium]MBP3929112.1 hypothetical protein [Peptostreptococcaceae bacterium]
MSEEEFYSATPKKLFKLAEIHNEINNPNSSKKQKTNKSEGKYIDQISL